MAQIPLPVHGADSGTSHGEDTQDSIPEAPISAVPSGHGDPSPAYRAPCRLRTRLGTQKSIRGPSAVPRQEKPEQFSYN